MNADAARSSRLEAVVQSFLRPEPAPALQVVVASAAPPSRIEPVSRAVFEAANSLGFETGMLGDAPPAETTESPKGRSKGLWIVEAGGVHEEWLARLSPPEERGPELLLWVHGGPDGWLRESYLFGMLRWSLAPAKSVALMPGGEPDLVEHLRSLNSPDAEVVAPPYPMDQAAAARSLMQQLLQSAMAVASRRPRRAFRLGRSARA